MTLAEAESLLLKYVGPVAETTSEQFLATLNHLRKRFFDSGKWNGMVVERELTPVGHVVTLPDDLEAILAAQFDGAPVTIFGKFHEFVPGGPGEVDSGLGAAFALIDQGNRTYKIMGNPDVQTVRVSAKLRYTPITAEDTVTLDMTVSGAGDSTIDGDYIRYGEDEGKPTYIKSTDPSYSIIPSGNGWAVTLNPPNAAVNVVFYYSASNVATPDLATGWLAVSALAPAPTVERRVISANGANEIFPDNIGALKLGLMSLAYEDNNDLERAEQYFSKALYLLNGETKEARGASQNVIQLSPHGFNLGVRKTPRIN